MSDHRSLHDLVRNVLQMRTNKDINLVLRSFTEDAARLTYLVAQGAAKAGDRDEDIANTVKRHPVCVLYADHIATLTGSQVGLRLEKSLEWCESVARECRYAPIPSDTN